MSEENADRLILTKPYIPREEIIQKHINSKEPTALISPSQDMGIQLKDDLSRFQIIAKMPYPDLGVKRINAKYVASITRWMEKSNTDGKHH